jgi:hypothetical protein
MLPVIPFSDEPIPPPSALTLADSAFKSVPAGKLRPPVALLNAFDACDKVCVSVAAAFEIGLIGMGISVNTCSIVYLFRKKCAIILLIEDR